MHNTPLSHFMLQFIVKFFLYELYSFTVVIRGLRYLVTMLDKGG
jgi:hypothetical protein